MRRPTASSRRLRVLVSPDSFKGSVDGAAAAAALARGWSAARPADEVTMLPVADGGEGTVTTFAAADPAARVLVTEVSGPLGAPVRAPWLLSSDGAAVLELAAASGLTLVRPERPFDTHTVGLGELLDAALDAGARQLTVGLGGSASTDGGLGALIALGATVRTRSGRPLRRGNRGLADVESVDLTTARRPPAGGVVLLTDVTNPLCGPRGAAAIFGPQKGAAPHEIDSLDAGLAHLATVLGTDPDAPGAGAAGGTAFGLVAWGGRIEPGSATVAALLGLSEHIADADVVLTGEGRFDAQSAGGKAAFHVARLAVAAGVPCLLAAGQITDDADTGAFADRVSLTELAGSVAAAQTEPERYLQLAAAQLAARFTGGQGPAAPPASSSERTSGEA